ncbi:3',5'-cyclic-nucleotide phosphodiesterase [Rhodovulum sp. PH10]|uniref:metallophosphoesterase family protein n=1 Tax=Rhodovulum sp. PH10 TaxID=1187851 RepID=UPI00027C21E5|nr:metallophosphoesterase [Rhodovulum sp. PH10]EJW11860.1 3',5'-cyclic-nucleotide phosphodiesterase [Rhodovulum sp. PH10]
MRIVHLSDLHFGRHDAEIAAGLAAEVAEHAPDLVVVSGDFTQIGSAAEFSMASDFLRTLGAPVFAVPGNHDLPARDLVQRFLDPYARYRRYIAEEIEPTLVRDGVALVGINTARRLRLGLNWAEGSIGREQLRRVAARFEAAPKHAVRVVVAHHPLLQPDVAISMKTVKRADLALKTFAALGVRLVLSGHFHLSYVRRHAPGEIATAVPAGPRRAACGELLVVQAATTISTRTRQEPNAFNVIDVGRSVSVRVREWAEGDWRTREAGVMATA